MITVQAMKMPNLKRNRKNTIGFGLAAPLTTSGSTTRHSTCSVRMSSIQYHGIQHAGVLVDDTEKSKQFYMDVLGMTDDTHLRNPKLPFKGAFMKAGDSQIHLMEIQNVDPKEGRPEHGGRDKHVAITLQDLEPLIESLEKHGRFYTFSKSGRRAVFTRDLDANALEFVELKR